MADLNVSSADNPYSTNSYSPGANDKNTLSITSYFKLLAAQLANQDMTSPMDNSEMMAQMTQMAMVQSVEAMTASIQTSTAVTTQTYAASMVGQEITVAVVDDNGKPIGVKYGTVASVNLSGGNPVIRLEGDNKDYPLSHIMGVGKIDDPFADKEEEDKKKLDAGEGADGAGSAGGTGETDSAGRLLQQRMAGIFG